MSFFCYSSILITFFGFPSGVSNYLSMRVVSFLICKTISSQWIGPEVSVSITRSKPIFQTQMALYLIQCLYKWNASLPNNYSSPMSYCNIHIDGAKIYSCLFHLGRTLCHILLFSSLNFILKSIKQREIYMQVTAKPHCLL